MSQPIIAKIADLISRPAALTFGVFFYTLGYIVVASSQNIKAVVAGQVLYGLGTSAITQINAVILADITPLQWRGTVTGAYNLPWVINAFIAGYITSGISAYSQDGWRWGVRKLEGTRLTPQYGMFCILVPVSIGPVLFVLYWGHHRAKKLGALTLASTTHTRQRALDEIEAPKRGFLRSLVFYFNQVDGFGLLLVGFSFACLLVPGTLSTTAKGGYKNRKKI